MDPQDQKWTFSRWLGRYVKASHMFMWGLVLAATGGEGLVHDAFPHSRWQGLVNFAMVVALLWELTAPGLAKWFGEDEETPNALIADDTQRKAIAKATKGKAEATMLVAAICLGVVAVFSKHSWAALAAGVVVAALLHAVAKLYKRNYAFAVVAWIVAGIAGSLCRWPAAGGFALVFVIGGLATSAQGVFEIGAYYRALHHSPRIGGYAGKIG